MNRRDLLKLGGAAVRRRRRGQNCCPRKDKCRGCRCRRKARRERCKVLDAKADFTLRIAPYVMEIAPNVAISTIAYNGMVPGPLMRVKEGVPVTVEVINDTDVPELGALARPVCTVGTGWRGGRRHASGACAWNQTVSVRAEARGNTLVPHAHDGHERSAPGRLHRAVRIHAHRGKQQSRNYDQEVFLALRDWEPFFSSLDTDEMDTSGPQPEKPATPDKRPNGMEVSSNICSINDKARCTRAIP